MSEDIDSIVYEENGFSREMSGIPDYVEAVYSGRLTSDMPVKVYGKAGTYQTLPAGDVPILRRIFEGEDLLAPPPPPPRRPPPRPRPSGGEARTDEAAEPPPDPSDSAAAALPDSAPLQASPLLGDFVSPGEEPPPAKKSPWLLAAIAFVAGGALVYSLASGDGPGSQAGPGTTDVAPLPEYTEIGPQKDYYVMRTTNLRDGPRGTASAKLATLTRGDRLSGVLVHARANDTNYILVKTGQHRGAFLWASNVSTTPPPTLATTTRESRELLQDIVLRSAPRADAPTLPMPTDSKTAGTKLLLAGRTADGWYEVLRDGGGVGYVEAAAIERPGLALSIVNNCHRQVEFWMIYESRSGPDDGGPGAWTLPPFSTTKLNDSNSSSLSLVSPLIRYYARATDGQTVWSNTSGAVYGQHSLPMRETTVSQDGAAYRFTLTCHE